MSKKPKTLGKTMKTQNKIITTEIVPLEIKCGDLLCVDLIKEVKDRSDKIAKKALIIFKNGFGLSIVQGILSYGGDKGLYEIAPLNKDGCLDESLFDEEDQGDEVCGYCDVKKVKYYIAKLGNIFST